MSSLAQAPASVVWSRTQDRLLGGALIVVAVLQVIAGLLHPDDSPEGMLDPVWGTVHAAFFILLFVQLIGLVRVYALVSADTGWAGLVGFLLFALGVAGFEGVMFLESAVLPVLARSDATRALLDETGPLMAGPLGTWFVLIAVIFSIGTVLFGLMLLRSRKIPRWAGPLLVVAPLFAFEPPIPQWLATSALVVFSIGVAGLGSGIWKHSAET